MATEGTAPSHSHNSLKIGDIVLFQVNSGKERNGYIYSELSSAPYNFMTVFPVKHGQELEPGLPNVAFATFKVIAPNKYKANQSLKMLEEQRRKQASSSDSLPRSQRGVTFEDHQQVKLSQAKKLAKTEDVENSQEQGRREGSRVVYGDLVQLQHVASGKFVNIRSEASKTESNNLLVNLSKENSEGCIFKILPRYKVRSEGDEVRYNDQMKIESVKTQGQYFSCSSIYHTLGVAGFRAHPNFFELNLSATESSITLVPHFSPSNKYPDKVLRAGDCVRLFHREDECYVVAVGSFANEAQPISENVHCRLRRVDQRKHALPSTSANTYWQIEKEEDPRTGEVLFWEERCRIKHLPTRLYLAVCKTNTGNWEVTLKPRSFDESDLDTLFSFHALIEEGIEVLLDSYAQIKHLVSERWLHLERNQHYVRRSFDPSAKGLAGLQWDSAELFMLSTSTSQGDYDSFTLQEVPFELLQKFNYVAGIVPVLTSHIQAIDEGRTSMTQKQVNHVKDSLIELGEWLLTLHERDSKNNQKILRNLQIIEQLTEILKASQRLIPSLHHTDICRECYNVVQKYLEGDSRKNENYLARFLEFFQTQVHKGLNAEEVLVEIVQDNLAIVSKMAETRMEDMIEQFKQTKDARFLEFLSSLCVCGGRPIPSTQERLLNELVVKYGREVLIRTEVRERQGGTCEVVCYKPGANSRSISLRALKPNEDDDHSDYELLKQQLHLFGKLCKGNNKTAIDFLVIPRNKNGYISFKEAHECARDSQIDPVIRQCYVELILVMFVDVDDNRPFLDHLCYSFLYSELSATPYADTGDDDVTALTEVKNIHFPTLKDWFIDVLKDNVVLHCDDDHVELNLLFSQILNVLGNLIRNGYYDSEDDIDELIEPLIKVLDGKTDIHESSEKKKYSAPNIAVFEVKKKAIEVLELFFRFKFYVKLQKFIHDFKALEGGGDGSRASVVAKKTKRQAGGPPTILKRLRVNIDPNRSQDWIHSPEMAGTIRNRLAFLCRGALKGCYREDLELVLLDLSEYDCDELVTASLDLLTQMYFFEEELFNKAHQSQILINPDSIKHYERVKVLLPQLRQLLRIDPDPHDQERMKVILEELSLLMIVSPENNEPNEQNQIMLDSFGILDDILSYIISNGSGSGDSPTMTVLQQEVLQKCFCLLRYLTSDYKNVQGRLFNRIDELLAVRVPTPVLADLADLLTEVFTGGAEVVLNLTEVHVEKIFSIIVNSGNAMVQAQFMVTLEAMTKIEELGLSVQSMQALVVKNFCRFREKFCQQILGEDKNSEGLRLTILNKRDTNPPDPQLQLLLSVTDLLAACAEGKQLFIESVCQNIFSLEELINIVSNPLPPLRKRPFVRFLISVYMSTDRDEESSINRGGNTLTHGGVIWTYLDHVAQLLKDTAIALQQFGEKGDHQKLKATRKARPSSTHFNFALPAIKRALPGVTDDKGVLLPGLLEYIIEGVIPFLHIYYSTYFCPDEVTNEDQKEMEYTVSSNIAKNMIILRKELIKVCTTQSKIKMFREIVVSLHHNERIRKEANMDTKVDGASVVDERQQVSGRNKKRNRLQSKTDRDLPQSIPFRDQLILEEREILKGLARLEVDSPEHPSLLKYKEQEKLNATFKVYTRNYQLAYIGRNTAKDQIGSPVPDMEYNSAGEELPLGPNFQYLVQLYREGGSGVSPRPQAEVLLKQLEISSSRTEQLGERQQVIQDVLDVRCLQVLRALIHNQIMWIDPELKDRDPIVYRSKSDLFRTPYRDSVTMLYKRSFHCCLIQMKQYHVKL